MLSFFPSQTSVLPHNIWGTRIPRQAVSPHPSPSQFPPLPQIAIYKFHLSDEYQHIFLKKRYLGSNNFRLVKSGSLWIPSQYHRPARPWRQSTRIIRNKNNICRVGFISLAHIAMFIRFRILYFIPNLWVLPRDANYITLNPFCVRLFRLWEMISNL